MGEDFRSRLLFWLTPALLMVQLLLLLFTVNGLDSISLFCTAASSALLSSLGFVHVAYALLVLLGVAALRWARLRLWYVLLLGLTLPALPLQAWLVGKGLLYCDGP
jgi:hypothetical protein